MEEKKDFSALVPARYAINAAFKEMYDIWDEDRSDYWMRRLTHLVLGGKVNADNVETIINSIDSRIRVSLERRIVKRVGKIETLFDLIRMQPLKIISRKKEEKTERKELIILRRDIISLKKRGIDIRSGYVGIALDRHAIERLYEREKLTCHGILDRLRSDMHQLIRHVAFARAAKLIKCARIGGQPLNPGNVTFLPMGNGALIVEALQIDCNGFVGRRTLIGKKDVSITVAHHHPEMRYPADPIDKMPTEGIIKMTGTTYLSDDLLRPDQRDCLALFEDALEDVDTDALMALMGMVTLPHESHQDWPPTDVNSDKMMRLMRENVKRNKQAAPWRLLEAGE